MKEETRKLFGKAERALHAATILLDAGDAESAMGRAYYGMFHTAQALLREKDLASENTGVSTLLMDNISRKRAFLIRRSTAGCSLLSMRASRRSTTSIPESTARWPREPSNRPRSFSQQLGNTWDGRRND